MNKKKHQTSKKENVEILFGINSVTEALRAGRRKIIEIYISGKKTSGRISFVTDLAKKRNIPVKVIEPSRLAQMAGSDFHQGLCAHVSPYPVVDIDEILKRKKDDNFHFILLLENIVDPNNFGALARTAHCAGVDGIVILKDRSVSPTPSVSRASAGALEHVFISRVTNMVNTLKMLQEKGIWTFGLDGNGDKNLYDSDLKGNLAIVVGGEDKGIRPLVQKQCDFLISIPQAGQFNSLNASVAGGVVMYEALRQRSVK